MEQKKIIIVGASSGIGREMALIYATKGYRIGITGRREDLLKDLQTKFPGQIIISTFDVMGTENQDKIDQLIKGLGGLDLLIYNSGYGYAETQLTLEQEMITTKTNVLGFVEIVNLAFNYFVRQGKGQIALTSSVAAIRGSGRAPSYSASKAFMSTYAEGLNIKAHILKKDIIVTDIKPGFIDTNMAKGDGKFWVASPQKAAIQIVRAIENKKRVVYITKRWRLIAMIMRILPYKLYKRIA